MMPKPRLNSQWHNPPGVSILGSMGLLVSLHSITSWKLSRCDHTADLPWKHNMSGLALPQMHSTYRCNNNSSNSWKLSNTLTTLVQTHLAQCTHAHTVHVTDVTAFSHSSRVLPHCSENTCQSVHTCTHSTCYRCNSIFSQLKSVATLLRKHLSKRAHMHTQYMLQM